MKIRIAFLILVCSLVSVPQTYGSVQAAKVNENNTVTIVTYGARALRDALGILEQQLVD